MGRPRALAAVFAGSLLLAGCASGPSQVGAAAFVGNTAISLDQVQSLIDKAVREQPYAQKLASQHKLDLLGRQIVSQLVSHELINEVARREGLVADGQQVAKALATGSALQPVPANAPDGDTSVSQVLARIVDRREVLTDASLEEQLAKKALTNLVVDFDFVKIGGPSSDSPVPPSPAQVQARAVQIAHQFAADPAKGTSAINSYIQQSGGPSAQVPAGIGQKVPLAQAPDIAATPVFGTPANNVVAFPLPAQQSSDGTELPAGSVWFIALIHGRSADKPVATEAPAQFDESQLLAAGNRLLQAYADQVGVRLNPRYGVWNVLTMSATPSESTDGGVVVPFGSPAPPAQQQ
jgi:hypothetical protein